MNDVSCGSGVIVKNFWKWFGKVETVYGDVEYSALGEYVFIILGALDILFNSEFLN